MKKILFGVAALGLLGLAGAGLGLKAQDAVEAKAAGTATTVYCAIDQSAYEESLSISDFVMKININLQGDADNWTAYTMEKLPVKYSSLDLYGVSFTDLYNGLGCIQFQILDGTTFKTQDQVFGTKAWNAASVYNGKLWVYGSEGGDRTWKDDVPEITYRTVTEYAVLDGVKQGSPINNFEVLDGSDLATPDDAVWSEGGYHFVDWFTNEACTEAYEGGKVTGNLDLYAKFTSLVTDKYLYYVADTDVDTTNYIYSYGGDYEFGEWPGTQVTSVVGQVEVHGTLFFDGRSRDIYRIPFSSEAADTHVIFNGGGDQTDDLPLAHKTAYWFDSDGQNKTDADAGIAIEFLLEAEGYRNAVRKAGGAIADYSICGISSSDAATLCAKYKALNAEAKGYVDAAKTLTYTDKTATSQGLVNYSDIMTQLALIAGVSLDSASSVQYMESKDSTALLIGTISVVSVAGIGLIAYSRKRRAE